MIITDPPQYAYRRAPSTFQGLGADSPKDTARGLAKQLTALIEEIRPLVRDHVSDLRKVDPWWADNFDATARASVNYAEQILGQPETANFLPYVTDLNKQIENYKALQEKLKKISGMDPMLIGGIVLGLAAVGILLTNMGRE